MITKDLIEYTVELGERFPDMTNEELIFSCEEFAGVTRFRENEERVIVAAYDLGELAAKKSAKIWGVEIHG